MSRQFDLVTPHNVAIAGGNQKPTVCQEKMTAQQVVKRIADDAMFKDTVGDVEKFVQEAQLAQSLVLSVVGVQVIVYRTE